jgi:cell wall-associated NlpC family hydrolase
MCAAWVWHVFDEAGVPYEAKELAVQVYEAGLKASGKGIKNLAPGVVLFGSGSGAYNAGHVGIYVGGNLVIDNMGYQRITTLKEWTSNLQHYGTITTPKATYKGYVGWFWPEGVNLSK